MSAEFDYDVLIVGSGFGGSVSALRLAEKGWKVGVLEMGRRLTPEDFETAAHSNRALTWMPALGMTGAALAAALAYGASVLLLAWRFARHAGLPLAQVLRPGAQLLADLRGVASRHGGRT